MSEIVKCRSCNYEGEVNMYSPCASPYQDIRCPKCGSTNNEHNSEYQKRLFKRMQGGTNDER